ncbi:MAG TPA: proteasome assembly chaperone family protein [Nitrososphaerales archaeon]|nr:proteasome assembly chaperone family protein [Nitrososphaerales archaeon]
MRGPAMEKAPLISERVFRTPKASGPVLVCGLPGSGYVGKLAADHLVSSFKLKKVAEYTSEAFPPQVNVKEDGTVEQPRGEVYFAPTRKGKSLYVFTADAQPSTSEGEYALAEAVVNFAKKCGVKRVYTLAAYITGSFSNAPKVFGAGTSKGMIESLAEKGTTLMKDGGISGMNGLLIGVAALRGLEGACLLGETSGYVVDAAASKAVLEMLSKVVGITIDTSKLEEKAEETQKVISQLQAMAEQAREAAPQQGRESRPGYIG